MVKIKKQAKNHKEFLSRVATFEKNHILIYGDNLEEGDSPYSKGFVNDQKVFVIFDSYGSGNTKRWALKWSLYEDPRKPRYGMW